MKLFEKKKILFLLIFFIAKILGCFLYFSIAFKTGSSMPFVSEIIFSLIVIFKFLTTFEKKSLKISATLALSVMVSSPFPNVMFSEKRHLFEIKGFAVFQNVLLSVIFLVSILSKKFFFSFLKSVAQKFLCFL